MPKKKQESCDKCIYSDSAEKDLICRAQPPRAITPSGHAAWPIVKPSDWCSCLTTSKSGSGKRTFSS